MRSAMMKNLGVTSLLRQGEGIETRRMERLFGEGGWGVPSTVQLERR